VSKKKKKKKFIQSGCHDQMHSAKMNWPQLSQCVQRSR